MSNIVVKKSNELIDPQAQMLVGFISSCLLDQLGRAADLMEQLAPRTNAKAPRNASWAPERWR
jgi:hypothetical protein